MNYNELKGGSKGWIYQGIVCNLLLHHYPGSVPLYRYWNSRDHFYTTNPNEIGTTIPGKTGRHGYISEGITGYCYSRHVAGSIPLRRYYQGAVQDHFYTTNPDEIGTYKIGQVGRHGFKDEGVACYVLPR